MYWYYRYWYTGAGTLVLVQRKGIMIYYLIIMGCVWVYVLIVLCSNVLSTR